MGDGVVEVVEEVAFVGQPVDGADDSKCSEVLGAGAFEQHRDAAGFELGDDLAERLRAGGVEDLERREGAGSRPSRR